MSFAYATKFSTFDWRKAVSAASYLVDRTHEGLYIVLKMLYLADKTHLNQYGRFISGDWYVAMKKGPVPSETYTLLSHLRDGKTGPHVEAAARKIRVSSNHEIQTIDRQNYDELSETDIESLDAIIDAYRRLGKWAIRDMSHDEVWEKAWGAKSFFSNRAPMPMDEIAEHVGGTDLVTHVRDPQPGAA